MSKTNKYELTLPKMGESVEEATIVNWLKKRGILPTVLRGAAIMKIK